MVGVIVGFLIAVEARYERNPGIIGRMQGLKNDASPAKKEIATFIRVNDEIVPPTLVPP